MDQPRLIDKRSHYGPWNPLLDRMGQFFDISSRRAVGRDTASDDGTVSALWAGTGSAAGDMLPGAANSVPKYQLIGSNDQARRICYALIECLLSRADREAKCHCRIHGLSPRLVRVLEREQ
jgi:hypothetical protein